MSVSRSLTHSVGRQLQVSAALPLTLSARQTAASSATTTQQRRHVMTHAHTLTQHRAPTQWSQPRRYNSEQPPADEEVLVPELGDDVKDAVFIKWVKPEGAAVEEDEVVGTIETDKVACDVRAPNTGTLHQQLVKEGTKVIVGQKLAIVRRVTAADESKSNANDARRAKASGGTPVSGGSVEATVTVSSEQPEGKGSNRIPDGRVAAGPKAGAFKPKSEEHPNSYSAMASMAKETVKGGKKEASTRKFSTSAYRQYSTSTFRQQISGDPRSAGSGYGKSGQSGDKANAAKEQADQAGKAAPKPSGTEGAPQSDESKQQFYGVPDAPHGSKEGTGKSGVKGPGPGKKSVEAHDMQKGGKESSFKKASPTAIVDDGSKTGGKDQGRSYSTSTRRFASATTPQQESKPQQRGQSAGPTRDEVRQKGGSDHGNDSKHQSEAKSKQDTTASDSTATVTQTSTAGS